ncbi:ABC transporter substrate-binding protein [Amycolatopsis thermoflava]|uniref:Peptide/nickel transport system substrate-binding protein n=1 Tax=Amycolatopsis thermoflava TaxID=84480 RepID=A0A3N2GRP4_9PSEU|nr:ABC transporter substrate-binding protein [Amycolatopsis thermoflava]ROS38909.1 peptide/nickel transport system substrate-binding protein [Amycolatopsis thermoflava]
MSEKSMRDEDGRPILPVALSRRGFLVRAGVVGLATMPLGAFLTACSQSTGESGANGEMAKLRKGGTVTFAIDGTNGVLDPAVYTTLGDWMAVDCVCRGLTTIDFKTTTPAMAMAESSQISDDGKTLTFTLRQGVTFHDGSVFTAQDCVRSFNRQLLDQDPSRPSNSTRPLRGSTNRSITEVRAVDERTFRISLNQPDLTFLSRLTDISTRIISAAALDKYGANIGQNLVGAGPFKLVSAVPQQSVTLEAYDGYFGGRPLIDRLVLQQVTDPSSLNAGLQSGQITASSFVAHSSAKSLAANPKVKVYDTPRRLAVFLLMNTTDPALSDIRVRQAVNLCVDRAQIAQNAFFGYANAPKGYILPVGHVGYDESLADLTATDVAKAKQLITEAGASGRAVELIAQNNNWYPKAAQILEENLKVIGLVPTVRLFDPGTFSGKVFDLKGHQIALWERNGYVPDPEDLVNNMLSSAGSYANRGTGHATLDPDKVKQLDAMLVRGLQTADPEQRKAAYTEAQRFFADNFMAISMVVHAQNIVAGSAELGEINPEALSSQRMQMEKAGFAE